MGIMQVIRTDENHRVDFMPVDLVVNLMLAASWYDRLTRSFDTRIYPTVYHLSSAPDRQPTWCSLRSCLKNYVDKLPYKQSLRPYTALGTRNRWLYYWKVLTSHWLFGCILDGLFVCIGKKPKLLSMYRQVHGNTQILDYFLMRDWTWRTERTDAMRSNISAADQERFYFEPMRINWDTFWINYYEGIRRYVLKEDMDEVERTRARVRKIRAMQFTLKVLAACVMCGIVERKFGLVRVAIKWIHSIQKRSWRKTAK